MDFTLDPDQRDLRAAVAQVLAKADADSPLDEGGRRDTWSRLASMGVLDTGPDGLGPVEVAQVAGELGRTRIRLPYAETVVATQLLRTLGSAGDVASLLPSVAGGTELVVLAHLESRAPFGTAAHTVTAERTAETSGSSGTSATGWRLTGRKEPVSYVTWANAYLVSAVADGRTRLFLLQRDGLGVAVEGYDTHDHAGAGRVTMSDAPATLLDGDAETALAQAFAAGSAALCAEAVGAMDVALTTTVDYLKTRRQFDVPLQQFQALKHRAADMYIELEMSRSTTAYAAMALSSDPADLLAVSRAKLQIGRSGRMIGQNAIQLHGGIGITDEHPIGHYTSRLEAIEHAFGGVEVHLRVLADALDTEASVELLA